MNYTKEEELFLINNYYNLGLIECNKILKKSVSSLKRKVKLLNLKTHKYNLSHKNKLTSINKLLINPLDFINVSTEYHAYILGFLWGDGYVSNKKHQIALKICESDGPIIESMLNKTGVWNKYISISKTNERQNSYCFKLNNKMFNQFLVSKNYIYKSCISHQTILEYIPDKFKYIWLRGLIDADGCFYIGESNNYISRNFSLASTYEQNWTYLSSFLDQLFIRHSIQKRNHGKSKSSSIRFFNYNSFKNLGAFIYPNGWDNIGLIRKYNKWKKIMESYIYFKK